MPIFETQAWGTDDSTQPADAPVVKPKSTFNEVLGATWEQNSIWHQNSIKSRSDYMRDPNFDYKQYHEDYWSLVAGARNSEHAADLIRQKQKETANKEIIDNANWVLQQGAALAVGATNPINYLAGGPVGALGKTLVAKAAGVALTSAAGAATTEAILQHNQVSRTIDDAVQTIETAALFGGATAGAGHVLAPVIKQGLNKIPMFKGETPHVGTDLLQPLNIPELSVKPQSAMVAGGSDVVRFRTKADSEIQSIPFLPRSWTEKIVRDGNLIPVLNRSTNQRLMTSEFDATRNAGNVLLRTGLNTVENARGVANVVPVEVSSAQRIGDMATKAIESDNSLRETWWKKVESGEYNRNQILNDLRTADPSLHSTYDLNRTSFDKVKKLYMADADTFGREMPEIVENVKQHREIVENLDAEKIDFGLAKKSQLEEIATGKPLTDPMDGVEAIHLRELKEKRSEMASELENLKKSRGKKGPLDEAEKAERQTLKDRIVGHDKAIEDQNVKLTKLKEAFDNIIPDSKTYRYKYDFGSHYLSRMFDKGRIMGDPKGFEKSLMEGWQARNPDLDWTDSDFLTAMNDAAVKARQKIMHEEQDGTLGELLKNLDVPGNYVKDRTLNVDDRFLTNWTHDDVLSTQLHHISQTVVDIELSKNGVRYEDLLNAIDKEFAQKRDDLIAEFGVNSPKANEAIAKLAKMNEGDKEELQYAMSRLKRRSLSTPDSTMQSFKAWEKRFNKIAGMAQLGSSAIPNSLGDVASVAREFGHGRVYKIIAKTYDGEMRDDILANAKQMGVLSDLIDRTVREAHYGDIVADSMNPNKGFHGAIEQAFDRGLDKVGDAFAKYSLIDGWSKAGRIVASAASTDQILTAAEKGWANLSKQEQTDLAKFYIDESMLGRIAEQAKVHAEDLHGIKFAGTENWTDVEASRVFKSSVYAHTEHALNIPSIGSGSRFMTDNFLGRMLNRYKSFNNASHESTFLSSMQNREYSRIATGTLSYAFWGFGSVLAYDAVSGRDTSIDKYFGSSDKAVFTGWKILSKGGFMATGADAFATLAKLAGDKKSPIHDIVREVFPESMENELFPKFADVSTADKIAGPTWGYMGKAYDTTLGVLDGDLSDKDIHGARSLLPGQNIWWLRRGLDHVEETIGGLKADRNKDK